jgi:two-component system, chemotaxis family, CheB/CheR fusion protein
MGRKPAGRKKGRVRRGTEKTVRLEKELMDTRGRLKSLMETQEATNQELQSANEEIRSIERELQTANAELSKATDDLANVFANTDTALLLVGGNLRLHRFTPQAQELFSIVSADIGRSITEFPQFKWLAERISSEFEAFETECADDRPGYLKFQVLPFRTSGNRIDGAIIKIIKTVRETRMLGVNSKTT